MKASTLPCYEYTYNHCLLEGGEKLVQPILSRGARWLSGRVSYSGPRGARWLSGRVSDSGARGPGFETYRRRVVSLSKTLYSPKVLVNYPGSDGSVPI